MRRKLALLVLLALLVIVVKADETVPSTRIVGYYAGWNIYERGYRVTDIPAAKLTHINYAFVNISDEGECLLGDVWADTQFPYPGDIDSESLRGNFKQLTLLKQAHPHLKTLMSVGGWTWSGKFSDVALTADSRAKFAASCIAMMLQYGFDGIDLDWEYPMGGGLETNISRPEDKLNFTLLLQEIRNRLDARGELDGAHYLLTIAVPAGSALRNYELDKIHLYVDWMNLMAYDFAGGWSDKTNFHANLFSSPDTMLSADAAVQAYLAAGVPAEKLVLGVPFYGRAWQGVPDSNDGLNQPYTEPYGDDTYLPYRDIFSKLTAAQRFWDKTAQAAWVYDKDAGVMVSYDDAETLRLKAEYIQNNSLGGLMIWELSGDDDSHTLLTALYDALMTDDS
jgi:chitinase